MWFHIWYHKYGGGDVTRADKLFASIVNNPKDVRFEDLDKVLKSHGFSRRNPKGGSSHYTYFHPKLTDILTIPKNKPIKAIFVKEAISAIDRIERGEE